MKQLGFLALLTEGQKKAALAYRGDDSVGVRRDIRLYPDKPLGEPVRSFDSTFSVWDCFEEELRLAKEGKGYFDR